MKLQSIPSVLLSMTYEGKVSAGPAAIIEYPPAGDAQMRWLDDGQGIRAALIATILDEFYFSEDFRESAALLEGFPAKGRISLADALEEFLAIRGLGATLQPQREP